MCFAGWVVATLLTKTPVPALAVAIPVGITAGVRERALARDTFEPTLLIVDEWYGPSRASSMQSVSEPDSISSEHRSKPHRCRPSPPADPRHRSVSEWMIAPPIRTASNESEIANGIPTMTYGEFIINGGPLRVVAKNIMMSSKKICRRAIATTKTATVFIRNEVITTT